MQFRPGVAVFLGAMMTSLALVAAPAAHTHADQRLTLERPQQRTAMVVLRGDAPPRSKVRIVRRSGDGWARVATDRANGLGRYRVTVERPGVHGWVVRAIAGPSRTARRFITPLSNPIEPNPIEPTPIEPTPIEPAPVDACGRQPAKTTGSWWECAFVDEFDGSSLDLTKWLAAETSLSGVTNGPDGCLRNDPSLIAVGEGVLRLSAQRTAAPFTCANPYGSFTTDKAAAGVTTKGRFNQAFGRFAFRVKMPSVRVPGAHSALWLFPDKPTYGGWPFSGEIDVAEWYSAIPDQVYPSVHYADGTNNVHTGREGVIADVTVFHTYVLEWTPTKMKFFYDGALVFDHSWTPASPLSGAQPFDKPFNVVLEQVWGQLWNAPTAATPDRATMTVDWVRVWK